MLHAAVTQALEVLARVGQPVDVIDAHAVHETVAHELEHLRVRELEDLRVLDPHAREVVDREEAPMSAGPGVDVEDLRALPLVGPERVPVVGRQVVRDDVEYDSGRLAAECA